MLKIICEDVNNMLELKRNNIVLDLEDLLSSGEVRPYVFRTRLERLLFKINKKALECSDSKIIVDKCMEIKMKLNCLSDQSNQTPEGTLNSYLILKNDLTDLLSLTK